MSLVGFDCPLRGEKKLLLEQENLNSVLKSIIYLKPCMYLKPENVNIENEGRKNLNFLNLAFQNGKMYVQ